MNWFIPNFDQYITYFVQEVIRWSGENILTIIVITNILTLLKVYAQKTPSVRDDKIVSLLIYFFSFRWVTGMTKPLGSKDNPVVLKNEIK